MKAHLSTGIPLERKVSAAGSRTAFLTPDSGLRTPDLLCRIVIIHAGAIGDFILALPAIAALRHAYPQATLEITGHPATAELARMAGYADQIIALEQSGLHRLFVPGAPPPEELAKRLASCDGIVSWFGSDDTTYRAALAARNSRVVIQKAFPPPGKIQHVVDYLIDTITPLLPPGYTPDSHVPRLPIPSAARRAAEAYLIGAGLLSGSRPCVAIHPGSGGRDKCWPAERFAELAHALERSQGARILLIEGPADAETLRQLEAHWRGHPPRRLSQRPLTELAAILSCCDRFIGNDSGITHLAAAVGVRVLALFGHTDPAVWGPRGRPVQIIRRPLDDLTVAEVLAALSAG